MRKRILAILCLVFLTACSEKAREASQSQVEFQKAMATLNSAQQGFIVGNPRPAGTDAHAPIDMAAYRERELNEAIGEFQGVMEKGSEDQRIAAGILLADAQSSSAQYIAHQAAVSWAGLARHSTILVNQLLIVEDAAALAGSYEVDLAPLLAKLQDQRQETLGSIDELEKQAQSLTDTAAQLKHDSDALRAMGDADRAIAVGLRNQAFGKEGKVQDALYSQASDAQASATRELATAQKRAADLDVRQSELAIVSKRLELRRELAGVQADRITEIQKQQTGNRQKHDDAVVVLNEKIKTLGDLLSEVSATYDDTVEAAMAAAEKQAQQAIATLGAAASKAPAAQRRQMQADLLVKQVILASIYAQHVYAASGYRRTLEMLAAPGESLMPGVTTFHDAAKKAREAQKTLTDRAKAAIGEAIKNAQVLRADDYLTQLQAYTQNIDDAISTTTPAPPAPTAAPIPGAGAGGGLGTGLGGQ